MADTPSAATDHLGPLASLTPFVPPRLARFAGAYMVGSTLYRSGKSLYDKARNEWSHTVSIDSRDDLYPDVMTWLYETIPERRRRSVRVATTSRSGPEVSSPSPSGRPAAKVMLHYDGNRSQTIRIAGHRIRVEVSRETEPGRSSEGQFSMQLDKVTFTARDVEGRLAILEFLATAAAARVDTGPRLYISTRWGDWMRSGAVPLRDFATVALPPGIADDLIGDLTDFFAHEEEYNRLGLPWHRGYILQGAPGTGKTTVAKALAARFDLDMYFVPLADIEDDTSLLRQIAQLPPRSLLLLEDIDISTAAKERTDQTKGVSMSALLQALDGVVSPHGIITVMTTNHIDQLDAALVRTGRADRTFEIGYLTDCQLTELVGGLIGAHVSFPSVEGLNITPAEIVEVLKATIGQPLQTRVDAVSNRIRTWARGPARV